MSPMTSYRRLVAFAVGAALAAGCGTSTVGFDGSDAEATGSDSTESDSSATTESTSTSTSTSTTTTTTTTTTTVVQLPTEVGPPLAFDDEGVPINGQTRGVFVTPTGWVVPVLGADPSGGWRVWTPCGREATLSAGDYVARVDVVIDPGHGGPSEPGAVSPSGITESEVNLAVAIEAARQLEVAGYSVLLTRDRDERLPIVTRAEIALATDPIALVSIHHNAGTTEPSPEPGTEMWHQLADPESKRLAGILYEEARAVLDAYDVDWVSMSDAGAMARPNREGGDYYGMLRRPAGVPSVLAEFAYVANEPEAQLLVKPEVQAALAGTIVSALDRFVTTDDPGSGFTDEPLFRGYGPSGAGRTENCDDPALE